MSPLKTSIVVMSAFTTALLFTGTAQAAYVDPFNRFVILIDASGSYKARQAEAVAKASGLLAGLAAQKHKRWDRADEVLILSLDASPEVIWQGSPADLDAVGRDEWVSRFKGRSDYAGCTDVAAGLNLAAQKLNAGPVPTNRYLFVFSDLIDERPTSGVSSCASPRPVPGEDIDWSALKPISISAFWLPAEQKMAWDTAFKSHGEFTYRLHSISESAVNAIDVPEPAVHKTTDAERAQSRALLKTAGKNLGIGVAAVLGAMVLGVLGLAFFARRQQPRSVRAATPILARGVVVRGPVARMRIPPQA